MSIFLQTGWNNRSERQRFQGLRMAVSRQSPKIQQTRNHNEQILRDSHRKPKLDTQNRDSLKTTTERFQGLQEAASWDSHQHTNEAFVTSQQQKWLVEDLGRLDLFCFCWDGVDEYACSVSGFSGDCQEERPLEEIGISFLLFACYGFEESCLFWVSRFGCILEDPGIYVYLVWQNASLFSFRGKNSPSIDGLTRTVLYVRLSMTKCIEV